MRSMLEPASFALALLVCLAGTASADAPPSTVPAAPAPAAPAPAAGESPSTPALPGAPGDTGSEIKSDEDRAHHYYSEAEAAYKLNHFGEAARLYEDAYRIAKFPNILFDIAQASRRWYEEDKNVEHLKKAIDMYRSFVRDAPTARLAPLAQQLIPEVEKDIAADQARRVDELLGKTPSGKDGLVIADRLIAAGSPGASSDALVVLERVLAAPGNTREVIIAALERRARLFGATGDQRASAEAWKRALELDPGLTLPSTIDAPTREAFLSAQVFLGGKRGLALSHLAPGEIGWRQSASIGVRVENDVMEMVDSVEIDYRPAGKPAYSSTDSKLTPGTVVLEVPSSYLATLPPLSRVEYYLVARDRAGGELALQASREQPLSFTLAADPASFRWYHRWGVWAGIVGGVLAAGAAATAAVILTRPTEPSLPLWNLRGGM